MSRVGRGLERIPKSFRLCFGKQVVFEKEVDKGLRKPEKRVMHWIEGGCRSCIESCKMHDLGASETVLGDTALRLCIVTTFVGKNGLQNVGLIAASGIAVDAICERIVDAVSIDLAITRVSFVTVAGRVDKLLGGRRIGRAEQNPTLNLFRLTAHEHLEAAFAILKQKNASPSACHSHRLTHV